MARTARVRLSIALVGLLLASGCSSGGQATERADDASTTASSSGSTGSSGPGSTGPGEEAPGALRLALTGEVTFDPASASPASVSAMAANDLLHDTLTELGADGAPQAGLATFEPNAERTSWRFTLVDGATFADGTPIEAEDVVATLERIRAQGGTSLAAIQLEDVTSVAALDPRTVEVVLARPSAVLAEVLTSPAYGVIDRDLPPGPPGAPINPSGDHRVVEASAERVLLERREGSGPARVELRTFADEEAAQAALVAGEVDWAPVPAEGLGDLGDATQALVPFHAAVVLGMRTTTEPLSRPPLRQAVALAIDRAALAAGVFGPTAAPADGLVPEGVAGAPDACVGPCGADVDRARQLVAEAFPEGPPPPLRLLTDETETHASLARVLREQLAEVGLQLDAQPVDPATYAAMLSAGQQQLFLTSTLGVARTPVSHLLPWSSGSPDNLTGHRNELVDAAITAALAEPDAAVRTARWREVEAAILADAPVVPLVQLRTVAAMGDRAEGLVVRADGSIDVSGVALR